MRAGNVQRYAVLLFFAESLIEHVIGIADVISFVLELKTFYD